MRPGRLAAAWVLAVAAGPAGAAPTKGIAADEVAVAPGSYYVGKAMGDRNYRTLANASTPGFLILKGQVTQGLFNALSAWGTLHGYSFAATCVTCDRDHDGAPAAGVSWRDAAVLANALSEANGLDPVYRDKSGQPIRSASPPDAIDHAVVEPSLSGYRLPTIPEWQIAMRGADKALAAGRYGTDPAGSNALGMTDTAGPLAEWTASTVDLGDPGNAAYLVCNQEVDGLRRLSQCDLRGAGLSDRATGFRFVRRTPH